MYMSNYEWWDTTTLCESFNVDGACSMLVDATPCNTGNFTGGMVGVKHSDKTKEKMRQSTLGQVQDTLWKGGRIMKDGVVIEFECQAHVAKQLGISGSHLNEVLKGKRRSVKGWVLQ